MYNYTYLNEIIKPKVAWFANMDLVNLQINTSVRHNNNELFILHTLEL